ADVLADQLDEQQYEHGLGPCSEALLTGEVIDAPDLSLETRWNSYPVIAMGHGILAVHSVPLLVKDKPVGVLNLYADHRHAFGTRERQLAQLLAGQATIAVVAALRRYDEISLTDHLRTALASRSVIDQAIGIVMGQRRCSATEAFAMLPTISQRRHLKLRVVAADLVATTVRSTPPGA
ncbi:MAG TPA: GAF and ANTAR domain-containing protein, partial [Pseudonocardia sp.]